MNHFSPTEWIDFVQNVVTAERRVTMQEHLDQRCGTCMKMVHTWTTIKEFARCELFYEPPASAVRNAESYFVLFGLTLKERAGLRILRHVFDSFDFATLNGIRSSAIAPRQLMYNLDNVFIDLRVEQTPGSDRTALTGQVVDAQLAEGRLEEIPIAFLSRGDAALHTTTNQFGEFDFSIKAIEQSGLLLNMKGVALLLLLPERLAGSSMS